MYEQFFGLADLPFRLTPDPRYLFLSAKHADALAHLRLGLTESSGFVCITGDVGTGKTTLLRSFLDGVGPDVSVAYVFSPGLSTADLLRRTNRELGIAVTGTPAELIDALHEHLLAQRKRGKVCVVVIDEAQALPADVLEQLRLLSNLETATEKLLKIVLVGQPQLRRLLLDPEMAQLNQRLTLRWHMGPLAAGETAAYVRHRLGVASRGGGSGSALFGPTALWTLHHLAGGVPRLVNMLAHRALLVAYTQRRKRVGGWTVVRAYRELGAVPLPRRAFGRPRLALTLAAIAVVTTLGALGAPRGWSTSVLPSAVPPMVLDAAGAEGAAVPSEIASVATVEERLRNVADAASLRTAVGTILAAWHSPPLLDREGTEPEQLDTLARRRGLEHVEVTADRRMLAVFDVPVVVELGVRGEPPRHAVLSAVDARTVTLVIDGAMVTADAAVLDQLWHGRAHFFWCDVDGLQRPIRTGVSGAHVRRLQDLLQRAGFYGGDVTGTYDTLTEDAVREFQRSHLLVGDGLVGRLTRMALYATANDYQRPRLAAEKKVTS